MSRPLLELRQLSVSFPPQSAVVRDVDLRIDAGQCLALVGESGSGKSLTSLAVMGLLPASAQTTPEAVLFNGEAIGKWSAEQWRSYRGKKAAMVFQEPMTSLNPVMRCGAQVAEHLPGKTRANRNRVLELFEEVELPKPERVFDAYPHELSGGQKQRIMLAMAMAANPALLIADEPTTALDVTVQQRVLALIRKLQQKRGMGVLFITHDLGVVKQVADEVTVLFRGDMVERGAVQDILQHPKHPYTQALLACRPPQTGKPYPLPTVQSVLEGRPYTTGSLPPSPSQSKTPLLEVRELDKTFGSGPSRVRAVNKVSFEIHPGEVLGLVGESGCGKSTVSKCVSGLVKPDSGSLFWKGEEIDLTSTQKRRAFSRQVQLVFQDPYSSLTPHFTVGQALDEVLRLHQPHLDKSERSQSIDAILEEVGLDVSARNRYPHAFSGGQRQRVVIARALLTQPELLICDESVSALDVSVQAQILNLLNDLKISRKLAFLFISHDLSVVRYMSDRIAVMRAGQVVESGAAEQVYHSPTQDYTRQLMAAIPKL